MLLPARLRAVSSSFPAMNTYHTSVQYWTSLPYCAAIASLVPLWLLPLFTMHLSHSVCSSIYARRCPTFLSIYVLTATVIGVPFPSQLTYRRLRVPPAPPPPRRQTCRRLRSRCFGHATLGPHPRLRQARSTSSLLSSIYPAPLLRPSTSIRYYCS
ncbi:hypothetical protein R3P38DRAFT_1101300 [Favolaschia claudopus]|uniref:Uncharacterized protein n=1 Tax=Favolaschia claudopus TaxID=2862362 RepID=A0AAW0BDD6_9AGAR